MHGTSPAPRSGPTGPTDLPPLAPPTVSLLAPADACSDAVSLLAPA
ncbi:hypothetical protein [Streptomyces sp. NPDC007020]